MPRRYSKRIEPVVDHATGLRICAKCGADISDRSEATRYCSNACRGAALAKRRRVAARKGLKPWLYR